MISDSFSMDPAAGVRDVRGDQAGFLSAERAQNASWLAAFWRRALVGVLLLEIALPVDTYLFYNADDAQFGAISGFNISLTTICLFLLYLQWLPRLIVSSSPIRLSKSLVVYLAIVAASFVWAANSRRTLFDLFLLLQAVLIFVYFVNNIKTRADVMFAMVFLALGLLIEGSATVAVRFLNREISLGPITFGISKMDHRVTGSFGSPNVAASYIAILLAPCLSLFFVPSSKFTRLLAFVAIVAGGSALIMTMSRGGWLAAVLSLAVFLSVAYFKGWLSGAKFALLVFCAMMLVGGFLPTLASRLLGDDAGSAASRMPLNEISALMIVDHPLGVGANNWELVARQYAGQSKFREAWFYTVHNHYLLVLCELGWLGFFAYMVFMVSIIKCGWRGLRRCELSVAPLLLALTAAFAGQLIHMGFDIFNSRSQVQMICLVAALICVCADLGKLPSEDSEATDDSSAVANLANGSAS